mgnify:CR=1 FL=1
MLTFTIATDRRKWLVIRVPSGSVAIYETTEARYRYIPVAVSDMSDAISYIADRLHDCSEKRFSATYRGFCFAYACCDEHRFVLLPDTTFSKVPNLRAALECCVDYLTEKGGQAHAMD